MKESYEVGPSQSPRPQVMRGVGQLAGRSVHRGTAGRCIELRKLIASGKVDELADEAQIGGLKASRETLATDYLRAMRLRRVVQQQFREMFYDIDMWLGPSRSNIANKISEPLDAGRGPSASPVIPAVNLAGLPALSIPCGLVSNMPIGISFMGQPFGENNLIAAGKAFQAQTDWHKRRPPA